MPVLREQDFDKLAARVVDQFLSGKAKLADAAAAEAMNSEMNPDQIQRLTQSANTMAFLKMMEQQKAQGGDLTQEFDPIDARQVIRIVIDNTGVHVEPETGHEGPPPGPGGAPDELPDEMGVIRAQGPGGPPGMPGGDEPPMDDAGGPPEEEAGAAPPFGQKGPPKAKGKAPPFGKKKDTKSEKKDEEDDAPEEDDKPETPKQAVFRVLRLRKLAGVLEDQLKQAEWAFEDTFEKLAARFKRVYNDVSFEGFEKDALAEHGDAVGVVVLNMMRQTRGLEQLETKTAFEKAAALEDRHVSEESPELHLFGTLVKIAQKANQLQQGIDYVRARCA